MGLTAQLQARKEAHRRTVEQLLVPVDPGLIVVGARSRRGDSCGCGAASRPARAHPVAVESVEVAHAVGLLDTTVAEDHPASILPESLHAGVRRAAAAPPPAVTYGVNTPKFFADAGAPPASMYGDYAAIAEDMLDLGVRVLRHPNILQLTPNDFDFPDGIPLGRDEVLAQVAASALWTRLAALVSHLEAARGTRPFPKIAFTFLSLGGGAQAYGTRAAAPTRCTWSADHRLAAGFSTGDDAYDLGTLDPSSSYKQAYFAILAEGVAEGLHLVSAQTGVAVDDFVDSLEIGNEVEVRDLVYVDTDGDGVPDDWAGDAASWARIYLGAAQVFRDDYGFGFPLKLPALASSSGGGFSYAAEWSAKMSFLAQLLGELQTLLGARPVSELVDAIDLHYYHRQAGRDVQALAYQVADVAEVKDVASAAIKTKLALEVTIMETGTGTYCTSTTDTWTVGYEAGCEAALAPGGAMYGVGLAYDEYQGGAGAVADAVPSDGLTGRPVGANDFQAQSVWVRLASAAAAGATAVAWHAPMAPPNDTSFGTMGLRRDWHSEASDPDVASVRPSRFAMRRYLRLLGDAHAVELLLPSGVPSVHSTLDNQIAKGVWGSDKDVWAVRFTRPTTVLPYALLLFLDPYGSSETARVWVSGTEGGRVVEVATGPTRVTHGAPVPGSLPTATWRVAPAAAPPFHTDPFPVDLVRGRYPILLTSHVALSVTLDLG